MKLLSIMLLATVLVVAGCATEDLQEDLFEEEPFEEPVIEQTPIPDEEVEEPFIEQESNREMIESIVVDRVIEVEGGMYYFEPSTIDVEAGETIEFVFNNVQGTHDMWITDLNVGTEIIGAGQTERFIYTFEETGTFDFECTVAGHAAQGMVGDIIVS